MDTRYADPLIEDLWSPPHQYRLWADIERAVAHHQAEIGLIPPPAALEISGGLEKFTADLQTMYGPGGAPAAGSALVSIRAAEQATRHDVAAFLHVARHYCGESGRWLHYGLTSSDVVDTALAMRMKAAYDHIDHLQNDLGRLLEQGTDEFRHAPMIGRTHGQPAEPTTLGLRFHQWKAGLDRAVTSWEHADDVCTGKISGPVGAYSNLPPELEQYVLDALGLYSLETDCTQVVPRDILANWANAAAGLVGACARIATDYRLMAARGEVGEVGGPDRVGSSSMPHKHNPVTAEKICGLARLARGYASMLQPAELWEDRDLSHSCVERVAVPDLLHTVSHALTATAWMVGNSRWDTGAMLAALDWQGNRPYSGWKALRLVEDDNPRAKADAFARQWANDTAPEQHPGPLELLHRNPVVFPRGGTDSQAAVDSQASPQVG